MKLIDRKIPKVGLCLSALLLLPLTGASQPNAKSVAEVAACLEDTSTALVCSSKELSNVTLQCATEEGSYFYKIDDLEDVLTENLYEGTFSCPNGETVVAVFVKSGSVLSGAAPGAGQGIFGPAACPVDCPAPPSDEEGEDDNGEELPDDETPL